MFYIHRLLGTLRELIFAGINFRDFMFLLSTPGVILCFWPI